MINWRGIIIGIVIGALVTVAATVSIQYLVWGHEAPQWYAIPVMFMGLILGATSAFLGERYILND